MRYQQQCTKTQSSMALLGGALLGAAAMYLLDPEAGRRRREHLRETTGDALGRAGEAIGPTLETLRERAADVGHRLGEGASSVGSTVAGTAAAAGATTAAAAGTAYSGATDWLSNLGESLGSAGRRFTKGARSYGHDAADSARDYRDSAWSGARDYSSRAYRGARNLTPWTREEEESHYGAYTAAGLSAAALGAAAIYLFDPQSGPRRRKMAADQATRIVNDCGRAFRQSGRYVNDILNRSRGLAHETRSRFASTEPVSPETLMQRVRSEMGHVVTNASAISVMANNDGDITLTGRILTSELDALLSTVNKVPGVNQIINRLDAQDTPEAVAGGDAGTTAGQRL